MRFFAALNPDYLNRIIRAYESNRSLDLGSDIVPVAAIQSDLSSAGLIVAGYWTKPTEIDGVNLEDVYGHIYVLTGKSSFTAYEYREGPPVDLSDVKPDFFHDVVEYLHANGLQHVLGLQVSTAGCSEKMAEFDLGARAGTIMLRDSDAKHGGVYRVTGWVFEERDGIVSCKGNDVHAKTTKVPHKVFQDSKRLRNVHELAEALREEEIVS